MPRLLDLYCGQGGASAGYARAGFQVIGVDISPQKRYPFGFWQRDALEFLRVHGRHFDVIHASPPCQAHTRAQKIRGNDHPYLIEKTREALRATGKPYVIENVVGSPLIDPVMLCGAMFNLRTYRHRLFEANWPLSVTYDHPRHVARTTKMGRPVRNGEFMHIVGNFSNVALAREIMDMPWASRDGLREAIPPAYTDYIGRQLVAYLSHCQVS